MCITYLVDHDVESTIDQDGPDKNVAKDASHKAGRVGDHEGAVPVYGDKSPCQRSRHDGGVDEARVGIVSEVQGAEVEEVDNEDQFCPVEVGAHKEHDKSKVEEVVKNEVATDACRRMYNVGVGGKEVADVAALENEEGNPGDVSISSRPLARWTHQKTEAIMGFRVKALG